MNDAVDLKSKLIMLDGWRLKNLFHTLDEIIILFDCSRAFQSTYEKKYLNIWVNRSASPHSVTVFVFPLRFCGKQPQSELGFTKLSARSTTDWNEVAWYCFLLRESSRNIGSALWNKNASCPSLHFNASLHYLPFFIIGASGAFIFHPECLSDEPLSAPSPSQSLTCSNSQNISACVQSEKGSELCWFKFESYKTAIFPYLAIFIDLRSVQENASK